MITRAITNASVLTENGLVERRAILLRGSRISAIAEHAPAHCEIEDATGWTIIPGLVDVQVNGGGGRLFNDDPSVDTIRVMAAAHRNFGTTGLLPTLISDDLDVVARAIRATDEAIDEGVPGILGIHLEGPYLAPRRMGAHRADKLRVLHDRDLPVLLSARRGVTHITLAPECASADQIRQLTSRGVVVSLGHSDATFEQATAAIEAGARGFTHLFNAMSQLTGREPGLVGAALASSSAYAGVIADGAHVHPASLRVALQALGTQRLMLVTDAMSLAGTAKDHFFLQGRMISRRGDTLRTDDGTLAGSSLTMIAAVRRMCELTGMSFSDAVRIASHVPAAFLGLSSRIGRIAPGLEANLVALDGNLAVRGTWIGGQFQAV